MALLIKGNPKEGEYKLIKTTDGWILEGKDIAYCGAELDDDMQIHEYEAIQIPKGHGRLIDANKLEAMMYHEAFEIDSDLQKWDSGCWIRYKVFENCMNKLLPDTILEAEE